MKIGMISGALGLVGMIVLGAWQVDARFYQRNEASTKHTGLEKADKKIEDFAYEVAGRLDAKIKADVVDRLDERRWKILERYGRSHCIKVPDQRDRAVCRDAEKRMDELKRKKPARRR